jgi:hypothetical protein
MTDINPKYDGLTVYCSGCGVPMKPMGQWPKGNPEQLTAQVVTRYACSTCRIPDATLPNGRPVIFSVLEPELIYDNVKEEDGSFTSTLRAA